MFDTKSDYALNKLDKDAIVCPSATGVHIRLTREDFASETEFRRWKNSSDKNYHQADLTDHIYAVHTLSMTGMPEAATATASAESVLICQQEQQEREQLRQVLLEGLDVCLTEKQHRRLWQYIVDGQTVRQIADAEAVKHPTVVESIAAAQKKIREFLKKYPTKTAI